MKLFLIPALLFASVCICQENIDIEAIEKIKNEGLNNSQIEKIAFELIDKSGPRLTNSKGYERAANYAVKQLSDWGLVNATTEPWGEFGRGWEMNKSYIAMTKPYYMPFIAVPKAWTESTNGQITGKVVFLDIKTEENFANYKGKLKDAVIALRPSGEQDPTFKADALRYTEEELKEMEGPRSNKRRYTDEQIKTWRARRALNAKLSTFLVEEGAALIIKGTNGKHGTLFTSSPRGYKKDTPKWFFT